MSGTATRISYGEAIGEALRREMGRDPAIVLVASPADDPGIRAEIERAVARDRVIDVAPAERTVIGTAVGLAIEGMRPVCELGGDDLLARGLDQLAEAASLHRAEGLSVPVVVRVPCGEPAPGGPEDAERLLLPIAGLTVVSPANAGDAKGLLVSALRQAAPVCLLEHRDLHGELGGVPPGQHTVPIGAARPVRAGTRMTLVCHGPAVAVADEVAAAREGEVDLLDLRTLAPLDGARVLASVRRTGKLALVQGPADFSPLTGALTALVWEHAFEYLDAPLAIVRVGPAAEWKRAAATAIRGACDELIAY